MVARVMANSAQTDEIVDCLTTEDWFTIAAIP
jgi:hypothetical protein